MSHKFYTLDVFSDQIFGGNPLVVFPQGEQLSDRQMQKIAKEFNLSEAVFVIPSELPQCAYRLRIFTPTQELDFAGHPTIGAAYLLGTLGYLPLPHQHNHFFVEENVGPIGITIEADTSGQPTYAELSNQVTPIFNQDVPALAAVASMLNLPPTAILPAIEAVSCGLPFLFIPLCDRQALSQARLNVNLWAELLRETWAPHVYLFTPSHHGSVQELKSNPGHILRSRMFAPALGIPEDPATGSGATALGAYLAKSKNIQNGSLNFIIEQGLEIGRPSVLQVQTEVEAGKIIAIKVGGACVLVSEGLFHLDN